MVKYINRRYGRVGHLFQGRFHSKHVARDDYLLVLSRYIHRNPVRAGLVGQADVYPWSSARIYTSELDSGTVLNRLLKRMVDTALVLSFFGSGGMDKKARYREFLNSVPDTEITF